jgi:hypothetical protein
MKFLRVSQLVLIPCLVLLTQGSLNAQDEQSALSSTRLEVHPSDQAAASSNSEYRVHLRLRTSTLNRYSPLPSAALPSLSTLRLEKFMPAATAGATIPAVPPPGFYPADLSSPFGGPVVMSALFHPVYVDCTSSCWGAPAAFINDLGKSTFIHVADQYVGMTTDNRYTLGRAASVSYPILTALSDNDVLQIVHSAASTLGTGYGHVYHIFLPKGVDECFVGTTECYSPDNLSTFVFCAYHGSVTFSDIGHVLFTVEPYQNVIGCSMLQPSPNGAVVDSTDSVLGHETFETITDPDPPTGWIAVNSNGVFGEEIGDLCPGVDISAPYFEDPVSTLNGHHYEIQPMYSNTYHACSFAP